MLVRNDSIDWLKAVGIVTVVWIHAIGVPYNPEAVSTATYLVWWAVPGFLFASGFLHHLESPVPATKLAHWGRRLLPPYFVASILALLFRVILLDHRQLTPGLALHALLTGSAFGPYYYVAILLSALFLLVPVVARWPRLAGPLTLLFLGCGAASSRLYDPFWKLGGIYWLQRSPFVWWHYFLMGWMVARWWPRIQRWPASRCRAIGAGCALTAILVTYRCAGPSPCTPFAPLTLLGVNYAWITALVLGLRDVPTPGPVRWLSDATYSIFLYHLFFILAVLHFGSGGSLAWRSAAFVAGLAGTIGLVQLGRRWLGERARVYLG